LDTIKNNLLSKKQPFLVYYVHCTVQQERKKKLMKNKERRKGKKEVYTIYKKMKKAKRQKGRKTFVEGNKWVQEGGEGCGK